MEKKSILWKKRNRIKTVLSVIAASLLISMPAFAEQEKLTPEEIYQPILNNYTEVINASLNGVDVHELGEKYDMDYYWLNALPNAADVQYAFYDIDQNGISELFIQNSADLYDAFGYDGNKIVRLIDPSGLGNRGKLTLYQNGIIETLSYGGQASVYGFYRMSANGFTLEKTDQLYQSFDQYNRNGNKITEYEFQQIINTYESTPKAYLSWKSLPKSEERWKDAYIQFINDNEKSLSGYGVNATYKLVDINGDDIPELYICNGSTGAGDIVCTYADGSVQFKELWVQGFSYMEGKNIFMDSGGRRDWFYDIVYSIVNGRITELHRGEHGADDSSYVPTNADGIPIYKYFWLWDGVEVTKDEYNFKKSNVYNGQEGIYPKEMCTYAEIINEIYNYPQ